MQQLLPEAVITCYGNYDEAELTGLLNWADVVCIGCGLGTPDVSEQILETALQQVRVPCIIDADGLNLLSSHMDLLGKIQAPVILTPHMKEMSRLTGLTVSELSERRVDIIEEFAEKYPVVCVMKDSRTLVKKQGRHTFINLAGNSAMAKAGAGDVLAGVITGIVAQGMDVYEGAALGVFLHACGGDEARRLKGGYSVLARDLIDGVGRCMDISRQQTAR